MRKILYGLTAFAMILSFLYVAIHIPTFSIGTYQRHFETYGTAEVIGISETELLQVTQRLLGYMAGSYQDLTIYATVQGVYGPFFTQREVDHMVDVRLLFQMGDMILWFSVAMIAMGLYVAWYLYKELHVIAKYTLIGGGMTLAITLWLAYLFATDFVRHWWTFHDVFFFFDEERLWILDPQVDHLINMVPYSFFMSIGVTIGGLFVSLLLGLMGVSGGYLFYQQKNKPLIKEGL